MLKLYLPDLMVVLSASIRPPSAAPVAAAVAEAIVEVVAVVEEIMVVEAAAEVIIAVVEVMVSPNSFLVMNIVDRIRWRLRQPWRRR